ncbi:protein of unknown function DUF156 [Isosphaera pallida ATCC 43644]|uniref:Metal sensitive transcriptional repressor n=2 Tax=Isosphaera pallida TaxID=128 RepID=E8QYM1_ISOPI|nr:protein of unknown function DUF156 [Isosphaera pallida ATCC 43644]
MSEAAEANPYCEEVRRDLHGRLSKAEGQLRGVGRMIDDQRPVGEVLQQLASIRSAVKGITKAVMRSYLERRAVEIVKTGDPKAIDAMLETLIKFVKE